MKMSSASLVKNFTKLASIGIGWPIQIKRRFKGTSLTVVMILYGTTGWLEAGDFNPKAVYKAVCAICHGEKGHGKTVGDNQFPAIAGLPKWYLEDQLILFKYDGRGADHRDREGLMMHAMVRTLRTRKVEVNGKDIDFEKDIEEMAGFLSKLSPNKGKQPTWEATAEQLENGKKIYTAQGVMGCIRCHGDKFQGTETEDPAQLIPRAPSLVGLEDWYMLDQLDKFRKGVRGTPARTRIGRSLEGIRKDFADNYQVIVGGKSRKETLSGMTLMQAMSQTALATQQDPEQAMRDVIAYIYSESRRINK